MVLNGCVIHWVEVTSGIPQGSVLGPILFIIFINDMKEKVKSLFRKFADDSKMMGKVGSCADISMVTTDLMQFGEWTKKWLMPLNVKKSKVMHVGKNNPSIEYEISGEKLEIVEQEVDLGVIIRNDLKVEGQCSKAVKKANQILGLIARTFVSREKSMIVALYSISRW